MSKEDKKTMLVVGIQTRNDTKMAAAIKRESLREYTERVLASENKKILKAFK